MINCAKCGKENQDHYKFCLGCGAELAKSASPKPFNPDTPPHGQPAVRASGMPRSASSAAPAGGSLRAAPAGGGASAGGMAAQTAGAHTAGSQSAGGGQATGGQSSAAQPVPIPTDPPAPIPLETAAGMASATTAVSSQGLPSASALQAQSEAKEAKPGAATVECPQCGHTNRLGNRFCASCGFNLATSNPPAVAARPSAPVAGPAQTPGVSVTLTALRADGSEAGTFTLPAQASTLLGRDTGSIFAGDSYLSPRHASLNISGDQVMIRDEGSLNGIYLKLRPQAPWMLKFGDLFRIGQEIIKLEALELQPPGPDGVERLGSPRDGYVGRLALVIGRDTTGNAFPIPRGGVHCGRERGDILFSEDGYVSGLHCRIAPESDGNIYLTDVGSSNGTFVRLSRDHLLTSGDILLMGQQLFRVDIH